MKGENTEKSLHRKFIDALFVRQADHTAAIKELTRLVIVAYFVLGVLATLVIGLLARPIYSPKQRASSVRTEPTTAPTNVIHAARRFDLTCSAPAAVPPAPLPLASKTVRRPSASKGGRG